MDDAEGNPHPGLTIAGGVFGILAAFLAWYNALAGIADTSNRYVILLPAYQFLCGTSLRAPFFWVSKVAWDKKANNRCSSLPASSSSPSRISPGLKRAARSAVSPTPTKTTLHKSYHKFDNHEGHTACLHHFKTQEAGCCYWVLRLVKLGGQVIINQAHVWIWIISGAIHTQLFGNNVSYPSCINIV
jgi:GPR1/FUN34/yaaH family